MIGEPIPGFDPNHWYYDQLGNPISLLEWGRLMETDRTLRADTRGEVRIRTVYLGFVAPDIHDARLFGTVRVEKDHGLQQIQMHDSEEQALIAHMLHVEAVDAGFHCHLCRVGEEHTE